MNEDDMVIGSTPLILNLRAREETKDTILSILDEAVQRMSEISAQAPEKSIDRTLIDVAAATLVRTLNLERLNTIEERILASYAGK